MKVTPDDADGRAVQPQLTIHTAIAAYRSDLRADMLQTKTNNKWEVIWTMISGSPAAAEKAGRQCSRCRAQQIRHARRARLAQTGAAGEQVSVIVVILTLLPEREQIVARLEDGRRLQTDYLEDAVLATLYEALRP